MLINKIYFSISFILSPLISKSSGWTHMEKNYRGNTEAVCTSGEDSEKHCRDLGEHAYKGELINEPAKSFSYFFEDLEPYDEQKYFREKREKQVQHKCKRKPHSKSKCDKIVQTTLTYKKKKNRKYQTENNRKKYNYDEDYGGVTEAEYNEISEDIAEDKNEVSEDEDENNDDDNYVTEDGNDDDNE